MTRVAGALALSAGCLLVAKPASAEVTLVKSDKWEVYTSGRVNAFIGYAFGDARPTGPGALKSGGLDTASDVIPELIPGTDKPDTTKQGSISKMRVRSGFVPNVLSVGVRRPIGGDTTLKAQFSLWGTLETQGQRKFLAVTTDWREGFLEADGGWGTFTAGRFGSLFSRGVTETDFLYLHGYGVGFWGYGGLYGVGPTAGLIGFGVLANSFSPGLMYTTPSMAGVKLAVGIFDPVDMPGSWETSRYARPEAELTYDYGAPKDAFRLHVYVNGAWQKVYVSTKDETVRGVAGGFRAEIGDFHFGAGGHTGKGLGLYYALEGSEADVPGAGEPFRTATGFSLFAQYCFPSVDVNAGFGQSSITLLPLDKTPAHMNDHPIRAQTGIAGAVVYHANESLHFDLDFVRMQARWYAGAKQNVNFINTGVTLTW